MERPNIKANFQTFGILRPDLSQLILRSMTRLGPTLERNLQRRAAVRYKLQLPVIFHWNDGAEHTEGGFTSDVALDGALILSSKCPPVGTHIRIEVLLPAPDQSGEDLRIECTGRVVRVIEEPGLKAFGVNGIFDDDHLTRHVLQ